MKTEITSFKSSLSAAVLIVCAAIAGCTTGGTQPPQAAALSCDDSIKAALANNADTNVLLVKQFKQGEPLLLSGTAIATTPIAKADLCMVKLVVGPGNPGPANAPSTSKGIGIEILLPSANNWNERIRAFGNGGWSGTPQTSLADVASSPAHTEAANKGFVVATSDNGHVGNAINASFAMNPDGTINTVGWKDFSERSLHELAVKTKLVAKAFYGKPHKFAYWDGYSTGGRQGLKVAQVFPGDFDGILDGAPAINWSKYHTANLYSKIAMKQNLNAKIKPEKLAAVTQSSIKACGGAELGFLIDPLSCRYNPASDTANICKGSVGNSGSIGTSSSSSCLTTAEANTINKFWYGQTSDGTAPQPEIDNGNANILTGKRVWFGYPRGTNLLSTPAGAGENIDFFADAGLMLGADQTALELQNPALGSAMFKNATANGQSHWIDELDYAGLANAQSQGVLLQPKFSHINTDNPNLSAFEKAGGKLLMYHGLADNMIPVQGSINYYERVAAKMGGIEAIRKFYRFYLIPGFKHIEPVSGDPSVPLPQTVLGSDELFVALQNWVEKKIVPERMDVTSSNLMVSLPLCVYPQKITYRGSGSAKVATSYTCK
ncbi:MAG: tannase/feruloyl esterase family alpha/beta hydrolase [Methylotenera sp.]